MCVDPYANQTLIKPNQTTHSFQTYTIPDLLAKASVRDVDMVTEGGPNCYANLTAAVNGEKQGMGER